MTNRQLTARTLFVVALAAGVHAGSAAPVPGQAGDPTAGVERARRYVDAYLEAFSAVVSEERQVQRLVRPDGRVRKVRELTSDFLLVKIDGVPTPQAFRDVIAVDGKPVRNREDRLRKLFLGSPKTALDQARAIGGESARHNIGLHRNGNSPLLPLFPLLSRRAAGFRFAGSAAALAFEEVGSPTVLASRRNGSRSDLPMRGSFTIEPESGRVLAAEFTTAAPAPAVTASLAVRYAEDTRLKLMVPIDVQERYWFPSQPKDDRLEVSSTYTNFRRFDVSATEQIKLGPYHPPPD
jgi:hypothetical protein